MGVLRALSRVLLGFVLACVVAGMVQVLYVRTPAEIAAVPASDFPSLAGSSLELTLLAATHSAIFAAAFALIIAGIAEWLSLQTVTYSLAAGMGIALLGFMAQYSSEVSGQPSILNNYALQAYLTAGFFGGLTYWLVAGRYAGTRREPIRAGAPVEQAKAARVVVEKASGEVKKGSLAERLANKRAALSASAQGAMTAVPVTKAKADLKPAANPEAKVEAKKPSEPAKAAQPAPPPPPAPVATAKPPTPPPEADSAAKTPASPAQSDSGLPDDKKS